MTTVAKADVAAMEAGELGGRSPTLDEMLPRPAWPGILKKHLSAAQLGLFGRCPEQFRRRYLLGEKERPAAALVWGSADHYAHEQNFRQKISTHEDISVEDVQLAFAEGFDRSVERDGGEAEINWGADKPGDLKDQGVAVVAAYHRQVSPSVQPVAVEQNVRRQIQGVPVPVIGRVDVITDTTAIERKTARAKKTTPEPHWRLQGRIYQAATGKTTAWHISAKTKTPGIYTPTEEPGLLLPFSPKAVAVTEERVRKMVASLLHLCTTFGADEPWPTSAPDYGWACGYCGFRPTCPWWAGT